MALVIGNSNYIALPTLRNPTNDAASVADVLRKTGFDVIAETNQDRLAVDAAIERFFRALDGAEVSLFYYSGHAVQLAGTNYIVPTDAKLATPYDIEIQTISVETILSQMRSKTKTQLVFLDACRDNPFRTEKFWIVDKLQPVADRKGLAQIRPGVGSLISFSTEPGSVAYDGSGRLSPFTGAFVSRALAPNEEVRSLLTQVRRDVIAATGGRQIPWENSSLTESFYFTSRKPAPVVAPMHRVSAHARSASPLMLPEPQTYEESGAAIAFDLLPEQGRLTLDGKTVAVNQTYPAASLSRLVFDASNVAPGFIGLAGYMVSDRYEQTSRGFIGITVVDATDSQTKSAAPTDRTAALAQRAAAEGEAFAASFGRRRQIEIGVGPVAVSPADTPWSGQTEPPTLAVVSVPQKGVVTHRGFPVLAGARLSASDAGQLLYEPQIGSQGQTFTIETVLGSAAAGRHERKIRTELEPVLNACDALAGEPLDLQGVAPGRLPNEIDAPKAIAACTAAARTYPQIARFHYQLGRAHLAGRNIEAAWAEFEESARRGHTRALHQLGYMYAVGAGRPADRHRANEYYKQNADRGDPYGIYNYGRAVFYGRGMQADVAAGLELMLRAAEMGHTYAMNELGAIFLGDRGVARDEGRAIGFYNAGAARKDIYSYNNLALAYLDGNGVPKDPRRALEFFRRAADGGHPAAPGHLGRMYRDGVFVRKDPREAARLFEMSAERGDGWAAAARAQLSINDRSAPSQAAAAQFWALAVSLDRNQAYPAWKEQLRALPRPARLEALRTLARQMGGSPAIEGSNDAELDQNLVRLARDAWLKRNPRVDLF